jgi:DNA polymerase III delta subunit
MFSLIHGDNTIKSRARLAAYRDRAKQTKIKDLVIKDGSKITPTELIEALETTSLFAGKRLVVLENLFKHSSKSLLKKILEYLKTLPIPDATHLVVWENRLLTATELKKLPAHVKIEAFTTSPAVFAFTQAVVPGGAPKFIPLFYQAVDHDSAEFVFYMLVRQVRQLFEAQSSTSKIASWQKQKLLKQARAFTSSGLVAFHDALTDLDWRQKQGRLVGTFKAELENILLTM